ncbi:putative short-chain dehydrogenases/reductase [Podospora appendiculata]|uniref:Short-chain dehydrogenases/reductase n=1 Tax=Podospora appendiculata TaxID=314037 RepID=A0AAE1CCM3_9PEZI|nr:putative short-chain dehydrogenases/reductase [Podospora appendiculata]
MAVTDNLGFRCALVTGGGGGIGEALTKYLVSKGKKVLIAGRTESNLKKSVDEISAFIAKITKEHPELDCLVNNAAVQRPLNFLEDADFLSKAGRQELDINIRGPMHLKPEGAVIINVSSILGFIPISIANPVYNGTKAFMHLWSMNLRTQLRQGGAKIRVVEIAPPSVGTDLHRDREDPDDNKKHKNPSALTVEVFMDEITAKLERGDEIISAGTGNGVVRMWYDAYGGQYGKAKASGR